MTTINIITSLVTDNCCVCLEDKDIRARQFQNNQRALSLGSDDENELQKLNDFLLTLRNGGDDDDDCKP